jgi:membrane protease YdiL (CAAX protease family)
MSAWPEPPPPGDETREPEGLPAIEPIPTGGDLEQTETLLAAPGAPESESYFQSYAQLLPPPRFPNILDVALMLLLLAFGWLASGGAAAAALHYRLFGVATEAQAANNIRYTLGGQVVWYLIALALWILFFPRIWNTGFFAGIEWRAAAALRLRWQLLSAAFACFVLAMVDAIVMPGPKEAPIDQVFRMPGGAWALFLFGITLAPLMEELIFRGFLLPALCTAWDWSAERLQHRPAPWPDAEGKTKWSLPAMIFASIVTSVPFALMHGQQTSYSLGTFVLLVSVSLALCWVRLSTRSVAAGTVVHACYNLLLFALMIWGTSGFKHLDKM